MTITSPARAGAGTNQEGARRHNLGTLLGHVHRVGGLARAELTELIGPDEPLRISVQIKIFGLRD